MTLGSGANYANLTSNGGTDIFVAKYNKTGVLQWAFSVGGTGADQANAITVDANGYIYITGAIYGTGSINMDPGGTHTLSGNGATYTDVFVAKYNGAFNPSNASFYQWSFAASGTSAGNNAATAIALDASGGIYITGSLTGLTSTHIILDPSSGAQYVTGASVSSSTDVFAAKYDGTQTPVSTSFYQWGFTAGGTGADVATGISVDGNKAVYITGSLTASTATNIDMDPSSGTKNVTGNNASSLLNIFVAKYDGTLTPASTSFIKWAFTAGAPAACAADCIALDAYGGVYVAGYITATTSTTANIDPTSGAHTIAGVTGTSGKDIFVAKYNGTLTPATASFYQWAFTAGGTLADEASAISVDSSFGIYIAGYMTGLNTTTVYIDPANTGHTVIGASLTSSADMLIAKYDGAYTPSSSAFYEWAYVTGSTGTDKAYSISSNSIGTTIGGSFSGNAIDFDPTATVQALSTAASSSASLGEPSFSITCLPPQFALWTGTASTDWSTAGNWASTVMPASNVSAVIPTNGVTNQPTLSGTHPTYHLFVNPWASLSLQGTLQIAGTINNYGTINATGGAVTMNGALSQTIPANTFSSNSINNLTINNSAGVTLGGALNLAGTLTPTAGTFTTGGYLTLLSTSSGTGSIAQGSGSYLSGNVNVQRYVGSSLQWRMVGLPFTAATTISQSALRGFYTSGYNAYSYNEAGDNGAYGGSGGVNAGWVPFTSGTITSDKGLLLSGGTISSAINFTGPVNTGTQSIALGYSSGNTNKGWNLIANPYASNINWTTIIGNNPSGVQNAIYRYDPNTTAYASYVNGSNSGNQSNVIENGAGFFVHSTSATTLSIQESDKTSSAAMASLFGVQPSTSQDKSIIKLSLLKQGETYGDEVVVRWGVDPATDGFDDKYDAYDLGRVKGADLSVIGNDGTTYSIFHGSALRSKDIEQRVIALGTKNMDAGNYSFNTSLLSAMYGGNQVYLVDNYSNQSTLIDAATASYPFVVTADPNSASVSRFILALNYKPKINTVTGNGILLLNNPSTNNQFNIVIGSDYQRVNWELVDNNGRVMQSGVFSGVMKGVVNIAQTQNTSAGTYFIKLIADGKVLPTQKWIKQ